MPTTDPALEILEACQWIKSVGPREGQPPKTLFEHLSEALEMRPHDAEYLDLMAGLRRRIEELVRFASSIDDPSFDDELRASVMAALGSVSTVFHPAHMTQPFPDATKRLGADELRQIKWFSQVAKRHRVLHKFTTEEREALLEDFDQLAVEIDAAAELDALTKQILREGLTRVSLAVRHFRFFGHDGVRREADQLRMLVFQALQAIPDEEATQPTRGKLKVAAATLGSLVLACSAFTAPDQVATALEHYRGVLGLLPHWPHRLPKPASDDGPPADHDIVPPALLALPDRRRKPVQE